MTDQSARIRALNDLLRQRGVGGRIFLTEGVVARGPLFAINALRAVREHTQFDGGNDPYGEHDFGAAEIGETRLLWKIDYYDATLRYGAEDPADASSCVRVLTIMLAEEY